jgi:long-subunit fatty acid transport protein
MGMVRVAAIVSLAAVLLFSGVYAGGFENADVGLRARGMGGAFRAIANDWTAARYNPAGYARLADNQLGANLALVHIRDEIQADYRRTSGTHEFETGVFNDMSIYNAHEILSNPSGGLAFRAPVWGETVFGFSIYQPFDYNTTWMLYRPVPGFATYPSTGTGHNIPNDQYYTNLDVVAFQITAGREFTEEQLYMGLGLQLLRADLRFNEMVFHESLLPRPANDQPYDYFPQWASHNGYGFGFGLNYGLIWTPTEKASIALTASLPFDITISGDSAGALLNFYLPRIGNNSGGYREGSVEHFLASGERVNAEAEFETTLQLPASFAIGFAYNLSEKLTVALDAQYMLWSAFEGFDFVYSEFRGIPRLIDTLAADSPEKTLFTSDHSHPVEWDNAGRVMLGFSYEASETMTLLGGGFADQSPMRKTTHFTPSFIDTGDKYGFSGGAQFHINQWDVGFVSSYTGYPDLTVSTIDSDGDGVDDSFPGLYKGGVWETVLAFNYRF